MMIKIIRLPQNTMIATMSTTTHTLKVKPLAQHVRFALFMLSAISTAAFAQTHTDLTATQAAKKTPKVILKHSPKNALPYCDDITKADLKAQPEHTTIAAADSLRGQTNDNVVMQGRACIARDTMRVQGDTVNYDYPSEQVTANGNAVMRNAQGDEIAGQVIHYNLSTQTANVNKATFDISATQGRGKAESIDVLSSRRAMLQDAYYTTCRAEDPDWYLKSKTMTLDQDNDIGQGTSSVLVFKNLPILATPYMRFPLGNKRQTGVLTPTMGISSSSGVDLTVPYYFNLAPNYDLTLYPGIMTKRNVKLGGEYRYLSKYGNGILYGNYLPNDKLTDSSRFYWRVQHAASGDLGGGQWLATADVQHASDNAYLDDITTRNTNASNRVLPSEVAAQYTKGIWTARIREKTNQTLQDSTNSVSVPYDFEPQITVTGTKRFNNWVSSVDIESTRFTHPNTAYAEGWRNVAYPTIRYEFRRAGGFITPKVGVYATQYNLSRTPTGYDSSPTRILPIASIDSGLIFERSKKTWLGRSVIQTLEPRLYYLYVPYKNQNNIWNFDSAVADFDLSHIYGENIFTGRDRIAQANQVTLGVTSRWLAEDTGEQLFQATAAQRHYLSNQQVTLPGGTVDTKRKSDLLLSASGQVAPHFWLDSFAQYNFDAKSLLKTDLTLRWQPAAKKVLNVGFQKNNVLSTPTESVVISSQWPLSKISKSMYGVARVNYDLKAHSVTDALVGIEYAKDCWVFRLVGERKIATSTNTTNNSIYFQLELKGLGSLQNASTETTLSNNISGYQPVKFEDAVDETAVTPRLNER